MSKDDTYKIEAIRHAVKKIISDEKKSPSLVVSLQANSRDVHQDIDKSINHLIKFNLHEVDSVDENNNQNGAIRE